MSLDHGGVTSAAVRLTPAVAGDETGVMAAVELGNRARATLGHMPFAGYREAAASGTLLLAYAGERIVGYALYGLTRRRVRLTHLCVDPEWRRQGVARLLVEWISDRYADHLGILVTCRENYRLGEMWIRLGFTQMSERRGRSKAGHILIVWWRDHRHPNLFTPDDETVLVRAAIDLNVLRDLAEAGRRDADESYALLDDQVRDRLEVVRTAALDAEINHMDGPLRARCTTCAQQFTSMRAPTAGVAQVKANLLAAARSTEPGYPQTAQDHLDLAHVAEAIAVNVNVFVTRDEHLTRLLGPVALQHGLRILRPVDVLLHLNELERAEAYRPAALLDTNYRQQLIGAGQDSVLAGLLNQATGERPREFRKTCRDLAMAGCDRVGIYNPDGQLVAAIAAVPGGGMLTVPLLRVANTSLADTIARQLLFQLRGQARDASATIIRITDRYLSPPARLALLNDGFYQHNDQFYAFVVDQCTPAAQVEHRATLAARQAGVPEPAPLRSDMPAVVAAELERIWWPAKITDSGLPTYLIPIQQAFSADLLGVPQGLLPRHDALGLAREHVYYRSPAGPRPKAPARLLWYMSSSGHGVAHPSGVIACSQLDAVVTGTPDDLNSRFRHLGVWDEHQIRAVARDGQVQALRFTNTELLTPVRLPRLRAIAATCGQAGVPPRGPLRVPPELFAAVYQEGRPR